MENKKIAAIGALHALGAALYVGLVVLFIQALAPDGPDESIFIPMAMLLLFCLSAAVMASLVFGRPLMWYLEGKKKEAVRLVAWTILFMLVAVVLVFLASYLNYKPVRAL